MGLTSSAQPKMLSHMPDERTVSRKVAEAIRVEMARQDITKAVLASRAGRRHSWISRRLSGVVSIQLDDLDVIARALGVPPELLLTGARTPAMTTGSAA